MNNKAAFDAARAGVVDAGLLPAALGHLTEEIAMLLDFERLATFKSLLKRFFSAEPWSADDAEQLATVVGPGRGWFAHDLGPFRLEHGWQDGRYRLAVTGQSEVAPPPSVFDRAFSGPVIPKATPHPRKVMFSIDGEPAPGRWFREGEPTDDIRAAELLAHPAVADVLVAGNFVTIGLHAGASWEDLLDEFTDRVAEIFGVEGIDRAGATLTRDELIAEGTTDRPTVEELHLLDPDANRDRVMAALNDNDARIRRVAVAVMAESTDRNVAEGALRRGYGDDARIVRRTAIDAAADRESETLRDLLERATTDGDAWTRWKAVRGLRDLGIETSRTAVEALRTDPDFQVQLEVESVLRGLS